MKEEIDQSRWTCNGSVKVPTEVDSFPFGAEVQAACTALVYGLPSEQLTTRSASPRQKSVLRKHVIGLVAIFEASVPGSYARHFVTQESVATGPGKNIMDLQHDEGESEQ